MKAQMKNVTYLEQATSPIIIFLVSNVVQFIEVEEPWVLFNPDTNLRNWSSLLMLPFAFSLMELMWLRLKLLVGDMIEAEKLWLLYCKNMGVPCGTEVDSSVGYHKGQTC